MLSLTQSQIIERAQAILADRSPIYLRMRAAEASQGYKVVVPGQVAWLPVEDWHESVVISLNGKEVRLVALLAKRPGSFRRLLAALPAHGLRPVVIGAVGSIMPSILAHLGWVERVVGFGWDAVDEWRPGAERTKVSSQASGQERVEPKQEINPSNGDEQTPMATR